MSDTSDEIVTKADLQHIAHMIAQETQREFYLEIGRVESELGAKINELKAEISTLKQLIIRNKLYLDYLAPKGDFPIEGEDGR